MLSKNKQWFERDGKPFFWLADTWWYGLTDRISLEEFRRLVLLRKAQGFTVLMVVVGVPPEIDFWSTQSHASGQHPFVTNLQPNPAYFDAIDAKLSCITDAGLVPCLVGGWGPQVRITGQHAMQAFWDVMIARLSKYEPVWCLCGEIDLVQAASPHVQNMVGLLPKLLRRGIARAYQAALQLLEHRQLENQLQHWRAIGAHVRQHDPRHLLLAHPHRMSTTDQILDNPDWLDAVTIQSGHDSDRANFLVSAPLAHIHKTIGGTDGRPPFINLEPWYEGIRGSFDARAQRYAFYTSLLAGARGHTYGADGLWNFRHTNDNFLNHWGTQTWRQASELPGAAQLGLGRQLLSQWQWWQLRPQFELLSPHWTPDHTDQPLCAQLPTGAYICYLPASLAQYHWLGPDIDSYTWYDPRTGKKIRTVKARLQKMATLSKPEQQGDTTHEDLLVYLELLKK